MEQLPEELNSTTLVVIPTARRDKVAHTHSYPIGAEALSRALATVPQIRDVELVFSADRFFNFSGPWSRRADLEGNVFCSVLSVSYRRRSTSLGTQWEYGLHPGASMPEWKIEVYPVFRDIKYLVRIALDGALQEVSTWLKHNEFVGRKLGSVKLMLRYNETDSKISSKHVEELEPERAR